MFKKSILIFSLSLFAFSGNLAVYADDDEENTQEEESFSDKVINGLEKSQEQTNRFNKAVSGPIVEQNKVNTLMRQAYREYQDGNFDASVDLYQDAMDICDNTTYSGISDPCFATRNSITVMLAKAKQARTDAEKNQGVHIYQHKR